MIWTSSRAGPKEIQEKKKELDCCIDPEYLDR